MYTDPDSNMVFEHSITAIPDTNFKALKDVYKNRGLIWVLAKREVKVKYSYSRIQRFWTILKPCLIIVLYLFVLVKILHVQQQTYNYPLVIISGFLVWQPFIENIYSSGKALFIDSELIKRSSIPRLIFPLYRVLLILPETLVMIVAFLAASVYLQSFPTLGWSVLILPFAIVLNMIWVLCIALYFNTWYFLKPDRHHFFFLLLPFVLWVTPVFYMSDMIPPQFGSLLMINPFSAIIAIYRYILLDTPLSTMQWLPGVVIIIILFCNSLIGFLRAQHLFSEKL